MAEQNLGALLETFNATQAALRAELKTQGEEVAKHGRSTEETGRRVKEIGERLEAVVTDIRATEKRVKDAETEFARHGVLHPRLEAAKTPGMLFTESEIYDSDIIKNRRGKSDLVEVGSFHRPRAATITSDPASGGSIVVPQRVPNIITAPERGLRIRDLIDVQSTDSNAIEYVQETGFTNAAATRAETSTKPESTLTYEALTEPVQVIAHWVPATRQIIADAGRLRQMIDSRLTYGLKLVEETQILYGNGVAPNLQGITTHDDVQTYTESTDGQAGDTTIDSIRRAMTLARIAEYPVTGVVLNPVDWEGMELLKGEDGHYIWVDVNEGGVMRLWRVPVVETNAATAGEAVLGAWSLGATLWDREQATVRISDSHADYFIKNMVAILAEERVALTIYRPEAFVVVTLDGAPAS